MSLYFDNFGGSGRPAWTNTLAPPAPSKPSGPPPGMVYSQAQPVQPQSQGTPYGAGDPRTGDPSLPPPTTGGPYPTTSGGKKPQPFSAWNTTANPFGQQYGGTFVPGGGTGNLAYAQPNARPQPFTQSATFGGQQFGNINDAMQMRDAFTQAANQAKAPFAQSWGSGVPNPPQTDIRALMSQAGDMVQGGWTNPFNPGQARPMQPPSQGTQYGRRLRLAGRVGGGSGKGGMPSPFDFRPDYSPLRTDAPEPVFGGGFTVPPYGRPSPLPSVPMQPAQPPLFGVYPPGTVSSPDSPVPAPSRPAPQGQAQPVQPPSPGTPYGQPSWRPKYGEYSPTMYYNDAGEMFSGSMSFAPGTSEADRSKAYGDWAERQGYFKRGPDGSKSPRQDTQYGTPPDQRGGPRTNQFIDGDGDGVDDRDQDGAGMPRYGAPPRGGGFERDAVGMPILRAPQVWTNPSDPEWLKRELQSKPDTRPVVYDEKTRTYINNPTFVGAPGYEAFLPQRPSPAAPSGGGYMPYMPLGGNPLAGDALPAPMPWAYAAALSNSRRAAPGRL